MTAAKGLASPESAAVDDDDVIGGVSSKEFEDNKDAAPIGGGGWMTLVIVMADEAPWRVITIGWPRLTLPELILGSGTLVVVPLGDDEDDDDDLEDMEPPWLSLKLSEEEFLDWTGSAAAAVVERGRCCSRQRCGSWCWC